MKAILPVLISLFVGAQVSVHVSALLLIARQARFFVTNYRRLGFTTKRGEEPLFQKYTVLLQKFKGITIET